MLCCFVLFCVVLLSSVVWVLGRFLVIFEVSWVDFWLSWKVLGGLLGHLGGSLGVLEGSWAALGPSWAAMGRLLPF